MAPAVVVSLQQRVGMSTSFCFRSVGMALLALSCAGSPKRPEASSPRVKDSASEKLAAQRTAAPPGLRLEQEDERWGFDAAREHRRDNKSRKTKQPSTTPARAVDVKSVPDAL